MPSLSTRNSRSRTRALQIVALLDPNLFEAHYFYGRAYLAQGKYKEAIARLVPMKRPGRADEVAELVAFLASEKAGYISGQIISINGAMA